MSSFKERVNEVVADLGGRIRNPLILSFIFVWLYQNWSLLYVYFNLPSNFSFGEKLFIIRGFVKATGFDGLFWNPLLFAFISLLTYYFIAITAQLLKLLIGEKLNAAIILLFDNRKYILKIKYDKKAQENKKLKDNEENLQTEIENTKLKLRQKESDLEEEKEKSTKLIDEKNKEIKKYITENLQLDNSSKTLLLKIQQLQDDLEIINKNKIQNESQTKNIVLEYQLMKEKLERYEATEKTELISFNPEDIFGIHRWILKWKKGSRTYFEEFNLEKNKGQYFFNTVNGKIEITNFRYDKQNRTVFFLKSNSAKNYSNLKTLLVFNSDGSLNGFEGDFLQVTYEITEEPPF